MFRDNGVLTRGVHHFAGALDAVSSISTTTTTTPHADENYSKQSVPKLLVVLRPKNHSSTIELHHGL